MAYYRSAGNIPHKRHVQHRDPEGKLYYEELMGEEGFSSDSSLLYHRFIPAAIREARAWALPDQTLHANDPMLPRHFKTQSLPGDGVGIDAVNGRRLLLGNADVRLSYVVAKDPSPYYRNAIGDECLYVHSGTARVETVFGDLDVWEGDYVIVPRATTHRIVPTGDAPVRLYAIEVNSHITPPKRYLSKFGQFLEHSPYCERDLRVPTDPYVVEGTDVPVHIKHRGAGTNGISGTIHVQPHHPFDVVGWDGYVYPYTFNTDDFEPVSGRIHQPPPVHQTFQGQNFVICSFCPRELDWDPQAIALPYHHSNVQSEEAIYYVDGRFGSRRGVDVGMITLHPSGLPHGPQPGLVEESLGVRRTEELAVMWDTFHPLKLSALAQEIDQPDYALSWSRTSVEA